MHAVAILVGVGLVLASQARADGYEWASVRWAGALELASLPAPDDAGAVPKPAVPHEPVQGAKLLVTAVPESPRPPSALEVPTSPPAVTLPPLKKPPSVALASFYRDGRVTANGERFDPLGLTAAHRTLPFGTKVRVTNTATGQSIVVRVNDRGPYVAGRSIDLSLGAARAIGIDKQGVSRVTMQIE